MKNIHVLPTDKPSRLLYSKIESSYKFVLKQTPSKCNDGLLSGQRNIYITSDEEIKEGDWFFDEEHILLCSRVTDIIIDSENQWSNIKTSKKIILTTDQDLINDGVQAIDDAFLEWFVKNPSCERVEVEWLGTYTYGIVGYKIIIPKEEPKQETLKDIKLEEVFGSDYCQFSVIENKLAILYRNQEQLLKAIKLLSNE